VYKTTAILAVLLVFSSCENKRIEKQSDSIENYLKRKNLEAEQTKEGVYYIIEKEGNGVHPKSTDDISVHYRGYNLEDRIFDSSFGNQDPISFNLTQVILGWQIGIPLLSEAGKGKQFNPSHLA
jgi:FKBP-type peptidyl-prolyl cis-trans isomerase